MHGVKGTGYILKQRPTSRNMEGYQLLILRPERLLMGRSNPEIISYAEPPNPPGTLTTLWDGPGQEAS